MCKYKNRLCALVNPKTSFKRKRKILIQKGVLIVPLLTSILSGVIGTLISNNNKEMALQHMIIVPPELWENRQTPPTPLVKKILQSKDRSYNEWTQVRLHQDPYLKTEKQKRAPIPIPI